MKATLKELEVIIPQKKEISEILRRIQQLAFDARLDILKFAPKGEIKKDFYAEWPIPIEVTGNYHNLAMFFDRLSLFDRIFNVEDFSIRRAQTQTDSLTITSEFHGQDLLLHGRTRRPAERQDQTEENDHEKIHHLYYHGEPCFAWEADSLPAKRTRDPARKGSF